MDDEGTMFRFRGIVRGAKTGVMVERSSIPLDQGGFLDLYRRIIPLSEQDTLNDIVLDPIDMTLPQLDGDLQIQVSVPTNWLNRLPRDCDPTPSLMSRNGRSVFGGHLLQYDVPGASLAQVLPSDDDPELPGRLDFTFKVPAGDYYVMPLSVGNAFDEYQMREHWVLLRAALDAAEAEGVVPEFPLVTVQAGANPVFEVSAEQVTTLLDFMEQKTAEDRQAMCP